MEELFGVSMNTIMVVLLAVFLVAMVVVVVMALRNPIIVKLGLRNIPRRKAQTALIIVGVMLSSVIISAALGTGDTINFSIRDEAVKSLGPIDEIIIPARATSSDDFSSSPFVPYSRFLQIEEELGDLDGLIDGMAPGVGDTAPVTNPRTSLSDGTARIVGVDPDQMEGFDAITLVSGGEVGVEDLAKDEVYINEVAQEELDAVVGDRLDLFMEDQDLSFTVKGVVLGGGIAGDDSSLIFSLARAQEILNRPGQINSIIVSNRGDDFTGVDLSEDVTNRLRVHFADRDVAARLKDILAQEAAIDALEKREGSLRGDTLSDMSALREELRRPEVSDRLISLLADSDVSEEVREALEQAGLREVEGEVSTLFADLGEFQVLDIKRTIVDIAESVGSGVTSFFLILGLFSIMVGILLIFLIFVMLAAARMPEMGMARAIGAKRSHLVQMFIFEGTAYSLVSAAIGVGLGLGAATLIVAIANLIFTGTGAGGPPDDFQMSIHFTARSIIVAYCLGMVITFATVSVSAYRISQMNIIAAIRGLPESGVAKREAVIMLRLQGILKAVARPLVFLYLAVISIPRNRPGRALLNLGLAALWVVAFPIWAVDIGASVIRSVWPYLRQGWLTFIIGLVVALGGASNDQTAPFAIGVSLMIIGLGLMIRLVLQRNSMRADIRDRIAYTFMGVVLLVFWLLPFDTLDPITGELEGGMEMFFLSGISMVGAAVWTVMYNSDLLLRALTFLTGRIGQLRPVMVTAVAYPMSAKFRTGLTLAMFGLVIFTLIVMSILTNVFDVSEVDQESVTGGWDIRAAVNFNTPITDIRQAIEDSDRLNIQDFDAIGGHTWLPIEARQVEAGSQRWRGYGIRAADDDFLASNRYQLKLIADGFGPTDKDVWEAMRNNPDLAVVDASVVPSRSGFDDNFTPFQLEGLFYEDATMSPIEIEVREPRTGEMVTLTVIGVMDSVSDAFGGTGTGMFVSKAILDDAIPFPVPITTYSFRVAEGMDTNRIAKDLEATFQRNGVETEVLAEEIENQAATNRAFNYLFTGFMGLGLMVGIASLGVISLRAVVERRQQIGVLRAIGYRRRMVQLSFLLESSFVALLGTAIGVALGTIISFNIVNAVRESSGIETLRFTMPWAQIVIIIAIAYVFSLATTFLPARQASRIYPAEALRYE